jgi:hypothetical protein
MMPGLSRVGREDEALGALISELRVRVLNGSATGCLVESTRTVEAGTVAGLRVNVLGREYDDDVIVMRCQPIVGAGSVYHVAMQFLSTIPPYAGSLRYAIHQEFGRIAGWLHAQDRTERQPEDLLRRRTADAAGD